MSVRWCDADDDKGGKARDTTSATANTIPIATKQRHYKPLFDAHVSQTLFVSSITAVFLSSIMAKFYYHQPTKNAKNGAGNPGFNRLVCECNSPNASRHAITMPVMENNPENKAAKRVLHELLVKYFVEVLGMDPKDEDLLKYYKFLWFKYSGMQWHADTTGLKHKNKYFLRFSIQLGDARQINYKAYKLEGDTHVDSLRVFKGIEIPSINTREGADLYAMSAYTSGVRPMCWADEEKIVGILLKHQVEQTKGNTNNIILDVPFPSLDAMLKALIIVKKTPFILPVPTEDGMKEYNSLLGEVAKLLASWAEKKDEIE